MPSHRVIQRELGAIPAQRGDRVGRRALVQQAHLLGDPGPVGRFDVRQGIGIERFVAAVAEAVCEDVFDGHRAGLAADDFIFMCGRVMVV